MPLFLKFESEFYKCEQSGGKLTINLKNDWNYKLPAQIWTQTAALIGSKKFNKIVLNFKDVKELDYAAALFFKNTFLNARKEYELVNLNPYAQKIFDSINSEINPKIKQIIDAKPNENPFSQIGKNLTAFFAGFCAFLNFMGEFLVKFSKIFMLKNIRVKEILAYFEDAGIKSVFIVCLTSFLIGIVLAYQGSNLLESFGATIIIVEMMGLLTLREIAPLIAAIIVAGRLASSFTAQIGVMKITEEIDAMKTMGFDPFKFLVLPRVIALIVAMPLIVFLADVAGIFGEMVVMENYLNISFDSYLARFGQEVEIKHLYVGLFKAPFFGVVIAFIGCMRGFQISGNTQSVGTYTTVSVVNAIFGVIMVDALFSIIFTQLGI
ncbi:ABC transporter permease [Campylobacter sp. Marseille-Q3452]|uniref:ABC transporter permease n=1 Tax=Campylobacter massiliensis TaxID=2762557 RepID=A0A842JD44_9BACT|nr:ABC transporter permease [Campylobacter massiliensis]MBC2883323.1 ABC transporter permease [Campylobacter massiliensis]